MTRATIIWLCVMLAVLALIGWMDRDGFSAEFRQTPSDQTLIDLNRN